MKEKAPNYVHPASYGKTTIAFLLDTLFTVAMIFVLYYAFGRPVLLPAQNYQSTYDEYISFMKDSSLTQGDASGTLLTYDESVTDGVPGWQRYRDAIINYYTVFIPGGSGAIFYDGDGVSKDSNGKYETASINAFVLKNVYKLNEDGSQISEGADPYFILDETTSDPYEVRLADAYKNIASTDNVNLAKLKSFFANSNDQTGPYYDAVKHLSSQPYFLELQNSVGMKRYISFLPSFILSPLIFFFILPVCFPDGRTLGKMIAKTAVIGSNGYKAKKLNIILHCALLTVVWECLLIPSTMLGIMAMAIVFLIDYLVLILSKSHASLHDKIARTMVVNAKESVWFKDEQEEASYIAEHPDSDVANCRGESDGEISYEESEHTRLAPRGLEPDTIIDVANPSEGEPANCEKPKEDLTKPEDKSCD